MTAEQLKKYDTTTLEKMSIDMHGAGQMCIEIDLELRNRYEAEAGESLEFIDIDIPEGSRVADEKLTMTQLREIKAKEKKANQKGNQILAMAEDGKTIKEIIAATGCRYQAVYNVMSKAGYIQPKKLGEAQTKEGSDAPEKAADPELEELQRLAKEMTCGMIAKQVGKPYRYVYNKLKGKVLTQAEYDALQRKAEDEASLTTPEPATN